MNDATVVKRQFGQAVRLTLQTRASRKAALAELRAGTKARVPFVV